MRTALCLAFLGMCLLAAPESAAQDFILPYNKAPETAPEFWAATKFELQTGNHGRAGEMLQRFAERLANLGEEDQTKLLLAVYDRDGLSPLLRLANLDAVRKLKTKDAAGNDVGLADALIQRMTKAIEGRLGDPARIEFFVNNLSKSPEERGYAMLQLRLAGARAVPALVKVLQDSTRQKDHGNIVAALVKMDKDFAPAALAALDSPSADVRASLLRAFDQRNDERVVPYLYYFAALPSSSPALKAQATALLSKFRPGQPVADARGKLLAEADRWYRQAAGTPEGTSYLWFWDANANALVAAPATRAGHDDYQALYWAKKALEVDPGYLPAQVVFLSAAIDRAFAAHGLEQPLSKTAPEVADLLAASNVEALNATLERAVQEARAAVAVGAARALGETEDPKALRPVEGGLSPLAKALNFPDRRVQFAAAEAMLRIPTKEVPAGGSRVIPVLARALVGNGTSTALVAHGSSQEAQRLAGLFRGAGLEAQAFTHGRALIQAAEEDGDAAVIALFAGLPDLPFLLSQLAENTNTKALPILLFTDATNERAARELASRYPKVKVLGAIPATADLVKAELATLAKDADSAAPSEAEKKQMAKAAVGLLSRLAGGQNPGYNLNAAEAALVRALGNDELAGDAAKVLGLRPGRQAQMALADAVLNDTRTPAVRSVLAAGLRSSLTRFGSHLSPELVNRLASLVDTATDPAFKLEAEKLAAFLRPDAQAEGSRLIRFPLLAPERKAEEGKPPEPKEPADTPAAAEKKDGGV